MNLSNTMKIKRQYTDKVAEIIMGKIITIFFFGDILTAVHDESNNGWTAIANTSIIDMLCYFDNGFWRREKYINQGTEKTKTNLISGREIIVYKHEQEDLIEYKDSNGNWWSKKHMPDTPFPY